MHGDFLELPGARLYYEVEGSGPALFLIHAGIANLRQWDPHVPAWAEHHRVIRYDTRGFGETETEQVEFANREDVAALLDHLGEPEAHILGCSRGGAIAIDFAVTHPERVLSLIEVAGGVGGYDPQLPPEETALGEALWKASEVAFEAKDWGRLADLETAFWVDGPGQSPTRVDPALRAQVRSWIYDSYVKDQDGIAQPLDPPAATRLANLTAPLLVVIGELDEAETNAGLRWLASEVRGARFEEFRGAAHMLNLEQPARFTDLVLDFLGSVQGRH